MHTHAAPTGPSAGPDLLRAHLQRLPGGPMGRPVHLWSYGHYGPPLIAFPTAGGYAHEWQQHGMVEALRPLIEAGHLKLYCPETNVAEAWTHGTAHPSERIKLHQAYERWLMDVLVPHVRADCRSPRLPIWLAGASVGAMYAASFALKHPEIFPWALCMSGRYEARTFTDGFDSPDILQSNPMAFGPELSGPQLERVQRFGHLSLVCGRGAHERTCLAETRRFAAGLRQAGVPHTEDLWGPEVAHEWTWWHRQARLHLRHRLSLG